MPEPYDALAASRPDVVHVQHTKFFGVGIVKTSENFGTQADWPSHPELLDWLATEFEGPLKWDMKAIQRENVLAR